MYQVKWKDCPHSLDCDGDIEGPAEPIHANGHELERGRVVVRYKVGVAPQEGTILEYNGAMFKHTIEYDDGIKEVLDLLPPQKEWRRIV